MANEDPKAPDANDQAKGNDKSGDKGAKPANVRKVKYMGGSNIRRIEKGDGFGGRLADGLSKTLEWNEDNAHVIDVDVDELGGDEVLALLLAEEGPEGKEFKDVTDHKVIPDNLFQKRWKPRGASGSLQTPNMVRANSSGLGETGGTTTTGGGSTATSSV